MVSARHLIGAGIVVSAAVVTGCAKMRQKQAPAPPPAVRDRADSPNAYAGTPGNADDSAVTRITPGGAAASEEMPKSLAEHTKVYARNLETLLSQRGGDAQSDDGVSTLPAPGGAAAGELEPAGEAPVSEPVANTGMQVTPPKPAELAVPRPQPLEPEGGGRELAAPSEPWDRFLSANVTPQDRASDAQAAGAKSAAKPPAPALPDDLRAKLQAKIKDDPRDTAGHLDFQLLQFLLDEPVPQLDAITSLPAEDRELLATLLDGLTNFRNGLRAEANMLQSKKVAPLLELAERLRSQGDLSLPTALLCTRVQRFGVYEPMDPPRFIAGRLDNHAILYCEVANFASQLTANKVWETKLKQEAVLYSESGLNVWSDKSDTVVDLSRKRLHDFFIADKVRIPENLPVGRYLLKMTVTDLHANRVAEATVPVQIVAQ